MPSVGSRPPIWLYGVAALGALIGAAVQWARLTAKATQAATSAATRFQLTKLAIRLLADPLPQQVPDRAYIFHELDCNIKSTVNAGVRLLHRYPTMKLLVLDVRNELLSTPIPNNFGGGPLLLEKLHMAGVSPCQVEVVPWDHDRDTGIHTLMEAQLVVRLAKGRGWRTLVLAAPPFHLVRAAMTTASVALREFPSLQICTLAGSPLTWEEEAVHSQGMLGTRLEFLDAEMERIERYTAKGDIAPADELASYFVRNS